MAARNFVVHLEELEAFRETLNMNYIKKQAALGVADATRQLHSALSSGVANTYYAPKTLDKVLLGKSIDSVKFGKTILKSGLEYKFEAVPLSKFFEGEVKVPAKSYWKMLKPTGGLRSVFKSYALAVDVKVTRARKATRVTGKKGLGGFLIDPRRANTGNKPWITTHSPPKGLYEREGASRKYFKLLYGPSLSQMAATVFDDDKKVNDVVNRFGEIVSKHIKL